MFVRKEDLPFDLAEVIKRAVAEWSRIAETGLADPPVESYGDFIAEEMNARALRQIGPEDGALFEASASESQFRDAIISGLDRWLIATERKPRTPQERYAYYAFNEGDGGASRMGAPTPKPLPISRRAPTAKRSTWERWTDAIANNPLYTALAILCAMLLPILLLLSWQTTSK